MIPSFCLLLLFAGRNHGTDYFSSVFYVENLKKSISLLKTLGGNLYECRRDFSSQPALEGSTAKTIFFFSVLCVKAEKITRYRFRLQKVVKIQKQYHF